MKKLSANQVVAVLAEAPEALTKLAAERDHWQDRAVKAEAKVQEYETSSRLNKIASKIEEKNLEPSRSRKELVEMLEKKASEGRLAVVEEAVDMSVAQRPLGTLSEFSGNNSSSSELESYILGDLTS